VQPVLDWQEREEHPHLVARQTYVELDGITQPAPAPRLSRTPLGVDRPPPLPGEHTREVARELGLPDEALEKLLASGALSVSS
jgi:alpha-methylacyl-CoA racemase